MLYFADAPTLVKQLATGTAPAAAYLWIAVLTFTTYVLAGHMREQVCVYMCPWPRIQAALTDEWALNVTYRRDRGEPRTSIKKAAELRAHGEPAGDCIDCHQCVAVCPTGIDIRDGAQLGCIMCGLCIDACDSVMKKVDRPTGLIAYDTDINSARRAAGKPPMYRIVRPRTLIYAGVIAAVGAVMLYTLVNRATLDLSVRHDRNPLFVTLSDGSIRNAYTVHLLNKRPEISAVALAVEGLPGAEVHTVGPDSAVPGHAADHGRPGPDPRDTRSRHRPGHGQDRRLDAPDGPGDRQRDRRNRRRGRSFYCAVRTPPWELPRCLHPSGRCSAPPMPPRGGR